MGRMQFVNWFQKSRYSDPRPYIGLRARLSQVWLNEYTIVLIIIVVKLALFRTSLNYSLGSAERYTMSSCQSAERMASQAASMPHYMATTASKAVEKSMDAAVEALITTIRLIITGVEELIIFALELWIGTYACLATAAVDSTAGAALNATQSVVKFVNGSLDDITDGLEDGLDGLNDVINTLVGAANDVKDFFTGGDSDNGKDDIHKVDLQIDALKNLHIPTSVNDELQKLEQGLPDYKDVKNRTESLIRKPFDTLKTRLNDTLQSELQFDASHIDVPAKKTAQFCDTDPGIPDFFEGVRDSVGTATTVLIIVLVVVAVLACVPVVWREIRNWRWMKECAAQQEEDKMLAVHNAMNHYTVKAQDFAANRVRPSRKVMTRWWVDYVLYRPAFMVLLLALTGILMVILQYIILYQVKNAVPGWEDSVEQVTASFTTSIKSEAAHWTNSTNTAIEAQQSKINDDMLGWVRTATDSVNDTLTSFQKSMNDALKDTFDGTPLYKPFSSVVYCVIGSKLDKAEQGLTWVHDNAKVSFPKVNDDYLTGANGTEEFNPEEIGKDSADMFGSALTALIDMYQKTLNIELYISVVLLVCWLIVALFGLLYCLIHKPLPPAKGNPPVLEKPPPPQYFQPTFGSEPTTPIEHQGVYAVDEAARRSKVANSVQYNQSPPRKSVRVEYY